MSFVMVSSDITTDEASKRRTESFLKLLSLSLTHTHTHTHTYTHTHTPTHTHTHTHSMTSSPPHSRFHLAALPLCHFNTLSAPSPPLYCHTLLRLHCSSSESFSFQRRDELTAATVRLQACWLQLSASHWFQKSVSILNPLKPARSHHWAKDYGKGH